MSSEITEETTDTPAIRILKIGQCSSLSGRSELVYHWQCSESGALSVRLAENTGKGMFNRDLVAFSDINALLCAATPESPITSSGLQSLYEGKSANCGSFLGAVLLHVGLISRYEDSLRQYQRLDPSAFLSEMQELVESGVSLSEDQLAPLPKIPKGAAKREAARVAKREAVSKSGRRATEATA